MRTPLRIQRFALIAIKNTPPNGQSDFPARNVVDGGFLELVRYGIRKADDATIIVTP